MLPVRDVETLTWTMSDRVGLATDVYRPVGGGLYPVLVMRLPYGRKVASTVVLAHPAWYAAHGYIVVVQDVRGRGSSEGSFRILEDDIADGAETLAFAADLDGGNGMVASYGFSYHGMNQFMGLAGASRAGTKKPDAMAIIMAAFDVRNHWAFEGDAFRMQSNQIWACQMAVENARLAGDLAASAALRAAFSSLHLGPVSARPEVLERYARYTHYPEWLADEPAYWDRVSPNSALAAVPLDVPVFHVGGWHDIMLEGTMASFNAFSAGNCRQRLTIGPWAHLPWGRRLGSLDAGIEAADGIDHEVIAFFDETLKDRENPFARIRLFDTGKKTWSGFNELPPTEDRTLYLASCGRAAPTTSDGHLVDQAGDPATDYLVHDPWRPAPCVGLHLGTPAHFADRAEVDDRSDVAVYTTASLSHPLPMLGAPEVELFVLCDRVSFDLDCTLSMVTAQGAAIALTSAHVLLSQTSGISVVRIVLRPLCFTVPSGCCLRLSLQASAFPAFAVNPGTGTRPQDAPFTEAEVATLMFRTGQGQASFLKLPVLSNVTPPPENNPEPEGAGF